MNKIYQKPFPNGKNVGFTLIELLVVVLIIGILSAIALPQYTKAVTKARFAEAFTNLKTVAEAVKVCEIANGRVQYSSGNRNDTCADLNNLDISLPGTEADGSGAATKYFWYQVDRGGLSDEDVIAGAYYMPLDVCMCIHDDGHFSVTQNSGCGKPETESNMSKLLGVEDGEGHCECC